MLVLPNKNQSMYLTKFLIMTVLLTVLFIECLLYVKLCVIFMQAIFIHILFHSRSDIIFIL